MIQNETKQGAGVTNAAKAVIVMPFAITGVVALGAVGIGLFAAVIGFSPIWGPLYLFSKELPEEKA